MSDEIFPPFSKSSPLGRSTEIDSEDLFVINGKLKTYLSREDFTVYHRQIEEHVHGFHRPHIDMFDAVGRRPLRPTL